MVDQQYGVPVATEFLEVLDGLTYAIWGKQCGYDDVEQSSLTVFKSETDLEVNSVCFNSEFYNRAAQCQGGRSVGF